MRLSRRSHCIRIPAFPDLDGVDLLEVVQAVRWGTEHKKLKGDQLKAEVDKQTWDDSVKSLVATPDVLSMMSKKLDWTMKLGDAVLAQQRWMQSGGMAGGL